MRIAKAFKITALLVLLLIAGLVFGVVGLLMFGGPPMQNGSTFADGKVTLVVDRMGPVRIGTYIVALAEGGFVLVDSGMDPDIHAIRKSLKDRGGDVDDVRAVFVTHAHDDHAGGARAFPKAEVFALGTDAAILRRSGIATRALIDGQRILIGGTTIEAFALPGHTAGSGAYLTQGVLFLGDAAASISDSAMQPNDFAYTANVELNHRSLRALAARLEPRRDEIRHLAFGHQGPLKGLDPLLDWASK